MCNLDDWLEYSPELFADRSSVQRELEQWLTQVRPEKQIRSLVGPPGVGKSWLLKNMMEQQQNERLVIWFDAPNLLAMSRTSLQSRIVELATSSCPSIDFPFVAMQEFPAFVENVALRLYEQCPQTAPLIIVDGNDNIRPDEFELIQKEYLRPFFSSRVDIFRMIIARRSSLRDGMLRKKERLVPIEAFDGIRFGSSEEQIERLLQRFQPNMGISKDYRSLLPSDCSYQWNHPFINTFLLCHGFRYGAVQSATLKECCVRLINRPLIGGPAIYPAITDADCEALVTISTLLPDKWDLEQFKQQTKKTSDDLMLYLNRGIAVPKTTITGPQDTGGFCIADGLRELLRDFAMMRQKERTK